ncbi:hypothetical protein RND81_11G119300 [Saponaria officinalis]|uniref:Avr9/Cf-9 rapidly elicited protein 146 n=1 Tax=Saponaria officinalis TaxID=3572 RepID=A0AAW1HKX2_SAPOF
MAYYFSLLYKTIPSFLVLSMPNNNLSFILLSFSYKHSKPKHKIIIKKQHKKMEQNTSMVAKKIWNIMRIAFFMLRKGICKRKILMDLNLVMKRGKIAGKALQNLMFHQHQHQGSDLEMSTVGQSTPPGEYEFSCSNTPLYRHYFTNNKRKNHNKNFFMPSPCEGMSSIEAMNIFDMMMLNTSDNAGASPTLSGSGLSPVVKQLRITDSPYPEQNFEDCKHVDEAAEDFINKFYSQLKNQN